MKKIYYLLPVVAIFILAGCTHDKTSTAPGEEMGEENGEKMVNKKLSNGEYTLNTEQTSIAWEGEMIAVKTHPGTIKAKSGSFTIENNEPQSGELTIDMTTIKSDEEIERLENHLRSADFFDVESHPESKLMINSFEKNEDGSYTVKGNLTIKGIENEIEFPAMISASEDTMTLTASFEIDRTLWDVRYGSDKFFDNLQNNVIKDQIAYDIELVASK